MYTAKIKGDKRIVEGYYIPTGYDCLCKKCTFRIEVPKETTDEQVKEIVKLISR